MENEPKMDDERQFAETGTSSRMKTAILVIGVIAVAATMALLGQNRTHCDCGCLPCGTGPLAQAATAGELGRIARPRLLDLGAGKCIPCKMMAPVLDELKREYEGRLDVEFVDVRRNPDAASRYGIQSIPTQIFFNAAGKELYRHQGFFAKEDILKKWGNLGFALTN